MKDTPLIYQADDGEIRINIDYGNDTVWANLDQISKIFNRDKSVVSRHIKNIFRDNEAEEKSVVAFFATTASDGKIYRVAYYNLDLILSVGYRINSKQASRFRQWATKILHEYMVNGYSINMDRIRNNYYNFLKTLEQVKTLISNDAEFIKPNEIIELIKIFSNTWFSLEAYDENKLPNSGISSDNIKISYDCLSKCLLELKNSLKENNGFFLIEREKNSLKSIFKNVMQSFDNVDLYKTIEEKAANLFYFIVKDHPFIDGNKRCGAYVFIWYLDKNNILNKNKINPETLTALTLFIAESNPTDKNRVIGLILQLLRN